jgi:glutamyl-tRNA synthetase
MLIGSHVAV